MRFEGLTAVVTGGATGIGYAIAERLASEGARVVIAGRRTTTGEEAEAALRGQGFEAAFHSCDVSDETQADRLMAFAAERYGGVDILVNNAALSETIGFLDRDTARWRKVFDVTVNGTHFCSRAAAERMIAAGRGGYIVNISSINGYRAAEGTSHYNAGKGAMDQLTRCMAVELAPHGIRVNGVAPGFIDTPMSVVDGENELETDWFQSIYVGRGKIPLRRAGRPEEIAGVVAFLASPDASYLCGAIIPADGGLSVTF